MQIHVYSVLTIVHHKCTSNEILCAKNSKVKAKSSPNMRESGNVGYNINPLEQVINFSFDKIIARRMFTACEKYTVKDQGHNIFK